jgi:hypothetical protein
LRSPAGWSSRIGSDAAATRQIRAWRDRLRVLLRSRAGRDPQRTGPSLCVFAPGRVCEALAETPAKSSRALSCRTQSTVHSTTGRAQPFGRLSAAFAAAKAPKAARPARSANARGVGEVAWHRFLVAAVPPRFVPAHSRGGKSVQSCSLRDSFDHPDRRDHLATFGAPYIS